jgi:DNA-directed RNA polymerase II subunit RPB1
VLADWMTVRGTLTPINRNGINRVRDVSVLRKASFEETADVMFGAAVFSEIDELKGVSERIIFGETIKLGTNSFEVILDRERVKNPTYRFESDRVPIAEEAN